MYDPRTDVVGAKPDRGGIPHCGIYDCMDFESDCRVCHTTISTGATICPAHAGEAHPVDAIYGLMYDLGSAGRDYPVADDVNWRDEAAKATPEFYGWVAR